MFFYYGYHREKFKVLYSIRKLKVPNSFKTTIFGQHKLQYEGGAFDEQKFSKLFFYLPATVTKKKKTSKYLTSVHFKPFHVDFAAVFEKNLTPQIPILTELQLFLTRIRSLNRVLKIKKNADAFSSTVSHDNEKLLWPGAKRTLNDQFALVY